MYTKLCTKLWVSLDSLKRDMSGVSAIEYAVLLAIVVGLVVAGLQTLDFDQIFTRAKGAVDGAMDTATGTTGG